MLLVLSTQIWICQTFETTALVTIDTFPAFSMQRECGRGCLQNTYDAGADVCKELGCCWNGCYCGTQYQAAATSVIRSCWSAYCGTSSIEMLSYDISTALSIYGSYCGISDVATTTDVGGEGSDGGSGDKTTYMTYLAVVTATVTSQGHGSSTEAANTAVSSGSDSKFMSRLFILSLFYVAFNVA